jgi:uncharacterized protein
VKKEIDDPARKFPDRRLGSSWYGWDGIVSKHESNLNEGPVLYFILLTLVILAATLLLALHAYIVSRFSSPLLIDIFWSIQFAAAVLVAMGWGALFLCLIAVTAKSPVLASPWMSRWLTMQEPFMAFCARPFGLSRDRIGSSCIALTNRLTRLRLHYHHVQQSLMLLPRCLSRQCVAEIREIAAGWNCPVVQVGTNAVARQKVHEFKPQAVIAIACERDLVSGLYDFGHRMPIMVIANRRSKGPCLEATVDNGQLKAILEDVLGEKEERTKGTKGTEES